MVKTHIKGRDTENKEAFKDNLLDNFASSNGWLKKNTYFGDSWYLGKLESSCLVGKLLPNVKAWIKAIPDLVKGYRLENV